ncbi:hypothetical protein [Anoxynatronum buryatiense]
MDAFNEDDWPRMIQFMTTHMIKHEQVMRTVL